MGYFSLLACLAVFVAFISTASAVKCYECNVWKAGYGQLCDNPRIREDCIVCMKTETTIYMGYYKNVPRSSTLETRVCGKSVTINFSSECHHFTTADGFAKRCFCATDLCNAAPRTKSTRASVIGTMVIAVLASKLFL